MSSQPALAPPSGVVPDFENPPSQNYLLIVTVAMCLTSSTLFVVPRFYYCAFASRKFEWDDGTSSIKSNEQDFSEYTNNP